jgi:hexosaminidase
MDDFISAKANKSIRIWGTFPPKFTPGYNNIHKDVSVQHWEFFEDNPLYDYIKNGYQMVNSNDDFYIVNKWGGSYPNYIRIEKTFHGDPSVNGGGLWGPWLFDQKNATNNPKRSEPLVLGAITPLWNDYGQNATVASEAYYAWRDGIPALSDKFWGGGLDETGYAALWPRLHQYIPAQNLDRAIPSKGDTVFQYKFTGGRAGTVRDSSPNKYDAKTTCAVRNGALQVTPGCSLTTPWSSKGRNYTLSLSLKIDKVADVTNATLLTGSDSALMLTPNVTLFASGSYYRLNTTVALGSWVDLEIRGDGNRTFASVTPKGGATRQEEFLTKMGINGERFHWDIMAIEAPIQQVGGWTGELKEFTLSNKA